MIESALEDEELLLKFRHPDTRNFAFNQLIHKYQRKVYWHIRKMVINHDDADDLTQDTFLKVWTALETFRGDAGLFTWIYRIATNECLNFLNREKRKFFLPIVDVNARLAGSIDSGAYWSGGEIQLKLQKALLRLPDKQRLVFNMKYFDNLTYEEISAVLGTSVGALKASYHLAVKKIHIFLEQG